MVVKMLHFADVHIGMENYGKTDPGTGLSSRVMDFVHRMDDMVSFALERDVDLVIFAGDAFKTRTPNPTFQREFAYRVQDLAEHVPVVLLVGNHDLPTNPKRASSIEVYNTLRVPNVYVGMDYEVLQIDTKAGPVMVGTAPYPVRSRLLEDVPPQMGIAQLDALLQEQLERILTGLADQVRHSDIPRVLTGHFTIAGAKLGSERQVMLGRDVAALLSAVADPAWDYVAMGHIHKYQDLSKDHTEQPPVVYSGSMERIDFGEEGDPKGFVWVELERGNTHYEFVPLLHTRPFITLRVDVRGAATPTQKVLDEVAKHKLDDAIVRVIITCDPASDALLNTRTIEEALLAKRANVIAAIQRQVERPERLRLGANPEGLTPPELLQRYFENRSLSTEQSAALMQAADEIFRAVDER